MQRRNARLRREYLYRKSLEGKDREVYEKKRKIREALRGDFFFPSTFPFICFILSQLSFTINMLICYMLNIQVLVGKHIIANLTF